MAKTFCFCLQVFAPTLPGYGRSEKPALAYSQHLWSSFLREFVVEVVRRPVVVVGNSIGGYISASLAAENPNLVQGTPVLHNDWLLPVQHFCVRHSEGAGGPRPAPSPNTVLSWQT